MEIPSYLPKGLRYEESSSIYGFHTVSTLGLTLEGDKYVDKSGHTMVFLSIVPQTTKHRGLHKLPEEVNDIILKFLATITFSLHDNGMTVKPYPRRARKSIAWMCGDDPSRYYKIIKLEPVPYGIAI